MHASPPRLTEHCTGRDPSLGLLSLQWEREKGRWTSNSPRIAGCYPGTPLRSNIMGITGGICRAQPQGIR